MKAEVVLRKFLRLFKQKRCCGQRMILHREPWRLERRGIEGGSVTFMVLPYSEYRCKVCEKTKLQIKEEI